MENLGKADMAGLGKYSMGGYGRIGVQRVNMHILCNNQCLKPCMQGFVEKYCLFSR